MVGPRTFESPMEWEFSDNRGPLDPHSPFTKLAQQKSFGSVFASKNSNNTTMSNTTNTAFGTPSKPNSLQSQPPPPQLSAFAPKVPASASAPPFRNPAFTTPRKPFDDLAFSEASGAESSPADTSDFPNDTPELDRMSDLHVGTLTPSSSKVDKFSRYGKSLSSSKRHLFGKGELPSSRSHREYSAADVIRKRKRHVFDKDVSSVRNHHHHHLSSRSDWEQSEDSANDSEMDVVAGRQRGQRRLGRGGGKTANPGIVTSFLTTLESHPDAPERLYNWIRFGVNFLLLGSVVFLGWSAIDTVRRDVNTANAAAQADILREVSQCQDAYITNGCSRKDRAPALNEMCDGWYECMRRDPEAIMRVKVTAKHLAEVINEFSGAMHYKAWGFFFGILILCLVANNLTLGRHQPATTTTTPNMNTRKVSHAAEMPQPSGFGGPDSPPSFMWVPVQTPRRQRLTNPIDGSDTEGATPPNSNYKAILPARASSRQRSPSKTERGRSPSKTKRTTSKEW